MSKRLPIWLVTEEFKAQIRGRERLCYEIECGHCSSHAIVERRRWLVNQDGQSTLTRPCAYCFHTGWLPNAEGIAAAEGWEVRLASG